jgi:hypothetical protein
MKYALPLLGLLCGCETVIQPHVAWGEAGPPDGGFVAPDGATALEDAGNDASIRLDDATTHPADAGSVDGGAVVFAGFWSVTRVYASTDCTVPVVATPIGATWDVEYDQGGLTVHVEGATEYDRLLGSYGAVAEQHIRLAAVAGNGDYLEVDATLADDGTHFDGIERVTLVTADSCHINRTVTGTRLLQ